jgi:hypothetical protein
MGKNRQKLTLQVNRSMVQVKARILAPPRILYGRNMDARAAEGSWNLRGKTVRIQLAASQLRTIS